MFFFRHEAVAKATRQVMEGAKGELLAKALGKARFRGMTAAHPALDVLASLVQWRRERDEDEEGWGRSRVVIRVMRETGISFIQPLPFVAGLGG